MVVVVVEGCVMVGPLPVVVVRGTAVVLVDGGRELEVDEEEGAVVDDVDVEDGKVVVGSVVPVTSAAKSTSDEATCDAEALVSAAFCVSSWFRACCAWRTESLAF